MHDSFINLHGKYALVTGASGDIGKACTILLDKLGAKLIITGTNQQKLENLKTHLNNDCIIKVCDLSDTKACSSLINDLEKIDILVSNAGINNDKLVLRMTEEDFTHVMNINLLSTFLLNKAAISKMLKQKYGKIVNISSVVAFTGNAGQANYCASKAGIIGMTKALANEVASRNITINNVAPGFIVSNMTDKMTEQQKESIMQRIPMRTYGTPEHVANAVAFLVSDASQYITGTTIHVNGGMFMN